MAGADAFCFEACFPLGNGPSVGISANLTYQSPALSGICPGSCPPQNLQHLTERKGARLQELIYINSFHSTTRKCVNPKLPNQRVSIPCRHGHSCGLGERLHSGFGPSESEPKSKAAFPTASGGDSRCGRWTIWTRQHVDQRVSCPWTVPVTVLYLALEHGHIILVSVRLVHIIISTSNYSLSTRILGVVHHPLYQPNRTFYHQARGRGGPEKASEVRWISVGRSKRIERSICSSLRCRNPHCLAVLAF